MDKKKSLLFLSAVAVGTAAYNLLKPIRSNVPVVEGFDRDRYLGTWYEIARMDFFLGKNLQRVQAIYGRNADGSISVTNRGYDRRTAQWKERRGKAIFAGSENMGALKVSFFGPFYAAYHIVHVDPDYRYALVFGRNTDYLWILARKPQIPEVIRQQYVQYAMRAGYATDKLVWTAHPSEDDAQ